jgi:type I restriction enzyme S subunit
MKRIGDILTRNKTQVEVEDGTSYKQVTIRTNYKGVVLRGSQDGSAILTKNQFRVSPGQFILSRIDARNGAFGIVPEELDGAIVSNEFLAFDINEDEVERDFFNVFLQSPVFLEACIRASRGNTNRKRVEETFFLNYEINLPPIREQHELIKQINLGRTNIATAQKEITHQETLLAKLQQAILQEAIQGKLTADWRAAHPDVEPASQLLHRIQAEKTRLIAAKKLRAEKALTPILSAGIPFDIPKNWEWCQLGQVGNAVPSAIVDGPFGSAISTIRDYADQGVPVTRMSNISPFCYDRDNLKFVRPEKFDEVRRHNVMPGDVLLGKVGSIGNACIYPDDMEEGMLATTGVARFRVGAVINNHYLCLFLNSRKDFMISVASQTVQPFLNMGTIKDFVIPLPPLAEQAAIVARVEALMTTCRLLEAEIEHARTHAAHLLQAVLKEAFAPAR